jgi:hypothetical protein
MVGLLMIYTNARRASIGRDGFEDNQQGGTSLLVLVETGCDA